MYKEGKHYLPVEEQRLHYFHTGRIKGALIVNISRHGKISFNWNLFMFTPDSNYPTWPHKMFAEIQPQSLTTFWKTLSGQRLLLWITNIWTLIIRWALNWTQKIRTFQNGRMSLKRTVVDHFPHSRETRWSLNIFSNLFSVLLQKK